jgi:16S rRNA (guanine(966)-N(2))-methyltransferase RsmD
VRIIAGAYKGKRLVTPRGDITRPTADQVRIALMDTLMPWLPDARLLDLFAGAGGVGLEALSRGAAHVTFVERDARAVAALRDNVVALGVAEAARVMRDDVRRALAGLARAGERFGLVFLDPPYETDLTTATLTDLADGLLVADGGCAASDQARAAGHRRLFARISHAAFRGDDLDFLSSGRLRCRVDTPVGTRLIRGQARRLSRNVRSHPQWPRRRDPAQSPDLRRGDRGRRGQSLQAALVHGEPAPRDAR